MVEKYEICMGDRKWIMPVSFPWSLSNSKGNPPAPVPNLALVRTTGKEVVKSHVGNLPEGLLFNPDPNPRCLYNRGYSWVPWKERWIWGHIGLSMWTCATNPQMSITVVGEVCVECQGKNRDFGIRFLFCSNYGCYFFAGWCWTSHYTSLNLPMSSHPKNTDK